MIARHRWILLPMLGLFSVLVGCRPASDREVVVYSALDREFSESILEDFERTSGITVSDSYDVESTKTVGLVTRIIQQQNRPACDLFWNNEILHTLRLEKRGLLHSYLSPNAADFPESYRSPDGYWHGFAARARVLVVNTDLVPRGEWPTSIEDLVDPRWSQRVGVAKPLYGTTATHAAVLFAHWGEAHARDFFRQLNENAKIMSGNKQVALAVGRGQLAFGLTDTDDAIIEQDQGQPVALVFPDQADDQPGALFIPNTLCIVRGGPNTEHAQQLVDYLLQPAVESRLARGRSAQFPVNPSVTERSRAVTERPIKWMEVDFRAAAEQWESAAAYLRDMFAAAN